MSSQLAICLQCGTSFRQVTGTVDRVLVTASPFCDVCLGVVLPVTMPVVGTSSAPVRTVVGKKK